jgi:DNA invertase Pin-like site-specific DNA recombinase
MNDNLIALPYLRVSSLGQETHGSGNDSQELRCRERATHNGWPVGEVFRDTFTGGGDFMDRPEMRRLIQYIKDNKDKKFVVIFDDIKRLARDTVSFILLTQLFKSLGVRIECLNHKMEDTPEGEFISTILAAQAQLERKQNTRQVIQKTEFI